MVERVGFEPSVSAIREAWKDYSTNSKSDLCLLDVENEHPSSHVERQNTMVRIVAFT